VVEQGTVSDIFDRPQQPYTVSLLKSIPSGAPRGAVIPQQQPQSRRIINQVQIA